MSGVYEIILHNLMYGLKCIGLEPTNYWDCRFESVFGHWYFSVFLCFLALCKVLIRASSSSKKLYETLKVLKSYRYM
jgi:hypothetical protein